MTTHEQTERLITAVEGLRDEARRIADAMAVHVLEGRTLLEKPAWATLFDRIAKAVTSAPSASTRSAPVLIDISAVLQLPAFRHERRVIAFIAWEEIPKAALSAFAAAVASRSGPAAICLTDSDIAATYGSSLRESDDHAQRFVEQLRERLGPDAHAFVLLDLICINRHPTATDLPGFDAVIRLWARDGGGYRWRVFSGLAVIEEGDWTP